MSVDEARKQSTHHAFSGDCQFFFAVGGGFSARVRLREGVWFIVLSAETGIKCFGAAFWKFRQ